MQNYKIAKTKTKVFSNSKGQNFLRKLEKIKPFSHSNISIFSKKPGFAHFPRPAETDPYILPYIPPTTRYADLPEAFKFFIEAQFRTIDVDGDGSIGESDPISMGTKYVFNRWGKITFTHLKQCVI